MWQSTGKKNCIEKVLWLFLWKLATFHNVTRLCMSPLTPLLAWRLAVASLPKHDIHPGCLRNTGLKQDISCKCSCASVLEPGIPRQAILVQKEQGLEEVKGDGNRKNQGTGGLGLSGQGKDDKKLIRGGGEVTQNCRSRVSATMGDKKQLSSSNEVEARTGWVRRRWEAQREGGQTKGRSGRSKRAESGLLEGEGRIFIAFQSLGVLRSYYTCQYI